MSMSECEKLWRVRKTVTEMLLDRGYILTQQDQRMTLDDFKDQFGEMPDRENLKTLASLKNDPTEQIFVFYSNEMRLGVTELKKYIEQMEKAKCSRAIMIVPNAITPFARQMMEGVRSRGTIIEQFRESELLINITQHIFVPTHIVFNDTEKAALLAKYKLTAAQLPRIRLDDAISRYYGLMKGQVVKIIRPSEVAGRYVTYRLCI